MGQEYEGFSVIGKCGMGDISAVTAEISNVKLGMGCHRRSRRRSGRRMRQATSERSWCRRLNTATRVTWKVIRPLLFQDINDRMLLCRIGSTHSN